MVLLCKKSGAREGEGEREEGVIEIGAVPGKSVTCAENDTIKVKSKWVII